jgi:hypothetical protein
MSPFSQQNLKEIHKSHNDGARLTNELNNPNGKFLLTNFSQLKGYNFSSGFRI